MVQTIHPSIEWAREASEETQKADLLERESAITARKAWAILAEGLTNENCPEVIRLNSQTARLQRAEVAARIRAAKLRLACGNGWAVEICDAHRCSMDQRKRPHAHRG